MSGFLGRSYRLHQVEYVGNQSLEGTSVGRWRTCIEQLEGLFSEALYAMYMRSNHADGKRQQSEILSKAIQAEYLEFIPQIPWMDNSTRAQAREKIQSLYIEAGFPKALLKPTSIRRYYKGVSYR